MFLIFRFDYENEYEFEVTCVLTLLENEFMNL